MFGKKSSKPYSIRKSRDILREGFTWLKKKKAILAETEAQALEADLRGLNSAVLSGDKGEANRLARKVEAYLSTRTKKGVIHFAFEIVVALVIALFIATLVRQMWFEIYEIPTGSMRPTFKEKDHVTVSKTAFGINFPLKTDHLYFDSDLVKRSGVVIFTADQLPLGDVDATYFGVLPYKKRFIKRMIGKPGDTLYFYGGQIYGIDKDGKEIRDLLDAPELKRIEYIPFLSFSGDLSFPNPYEVVFNQLHQPIGRLIAGGNRQPIGQIRTEKQWKVDDATAQKKPHSQVETYSDFWGMRNFAMARLLTPAEVKKFTDLNVSNNDDAVLYLELRHTPSLSYPSPEFWKQRWGAGWFVPGYKTLIPLNQNHLEKLMDNMYTARFVIGKGRARKYRVGYNHFGSGNPSFPNIPDGTYEFYYGTAYSVGLGGRTTALNKDHPLYQRTTDMVQKLFNQGIEFDTGYDVYAKDQTTFPNRYAYFRDGDLYLLGGKVISREDPILKTFHEREIQRQSSAPRQKPYVAFQDYGSPYKDGKIDVEFLKAFGLKVPEKHYLVLGDNHAMSSDSRVFGFLPEENLQGVPRLIIWPTGDRWGPPNQLSYPFFTTPRVIIWIIAGIVIAAIILYQRWRNQRSLFPNDKA